MVALIALLPYLNTLGGDFLWDDEIVILRNYWIQNSRQIPHLFSLHYWKFENPGKKGEYRPIPMISLALDFHFWKFNPWGFHCTNLLLHSLNSILVFFLVFSLSRNRMLSLLSAGLFALHPIHTESVSWIKNRTDLLCFFFSLLTLISTLLLCPPEKKIPTWRKAVLYGMGLIFFGLALLCKEMAVTIPLLIWLQLRWFRKDKIKKLGYFILPFFWGSFTYIGFKAIGLGKVAPFLYTTKIGLGARLLSVPKTLITYFLKVLFPVNLNLEPRFTPPISLATLSFLASVLLLILIVTFIFFLIRRQLPLPAFGLSWFFISLLPVANFIYLSGRPIAEQRLYLPSFGYCLVVAYIVFCLSRWRPNRKNNLYACVCFLFLFFFVSTWLRNQEWRNPISLWSKTLRQNPDSARAMSNLGAAYNSAGNREKASYYFKLAIDKHPRKVQEAYLNIAGVLIQQGKFSEAIESISQALKIQTDHYGAYKLLGVAYRELKKFDAAIFCFEQAALINPHDPEIFLSLGSLYGRKGWHSRAEDKFLKALKLNPNLSEARKNLALALFNQGKLKSALEEYHSLAISEPESPFWRVQLGEVYKASGNFEKAIAAFQKAREVGDQSTEVYKNLGDLFRLMGNYEKSESAYKKVLELEPENAEAYNNLGYLYAVQGRNLTEARKLLEKALSFEPQNPHYLDSLGWVYFKMGDLEQARGQLEKAFQLQPEDPVIYEHLQKIIKSQN